MSFLGKIAITTLKLIQNANVGGVSENLLNINIFVSKEDLYILMLFVSSPIPAIFYFKKGGQRQSKTKWDGSSSLAIFRKLVILSKVRRQYLLISLSLYLWLHEEAVTSEAHFNTLAINANYGGSFNHWY